MRALFVLHKQEVARLVGELGMKGDGGSGGGGSIPISILLHSAM